MTSFSTLIRDLTRHFDRAQPKDILQFCSNWFQSRLEEQRNRARDVLGERHPSQPSGVRGSYPNHSLSRRTSMYALGSVGDTDEAIDPLKMKRGSI
jgi:cAMP-dependent protein kinase regulator